MSLNMKVEKNMKLERSQTGVQSPVECGKKETATWTSKTANLGLGKGE